MIETRKTKILGLAAKLVGREVKRMEKQWPPTCMGILHQPKRPKKN